jgi:hypothetical protein
LSPIAGDKAVTPWRLAGFRMMRANIACVLALCLITPAGVHAEDDPSQIFRHFGLEGVWSPDCRRDPSRTNPRVFFRAGDSGPVTHAVTFDGRTFALVDQMVAATRLNDNQLRFSVVRDGAMALIVTIERKGSKIHTVTSIGANGTVYYRDGIEVATGKPGLSDERCDVAPSIS